MLRATWKIYEPGISGYVKATIEWALSDAVMLAILEEVRTVIERQGFDLVQEDSLAVFSRQIRESFTPNKIAATRTDMNMRIAPGESSYVTYSKGLAEANGYVHLSA